MIVVEIHIIEVRHNPHIIIHKCVPKHRTGVQYWAFIKKQNETWEFRGRYTIHCFKTNNRGVGIDEDKVLWHDSKMAKINFKVLDLFIFAIRRYSHVHGITDEFKVTGWPSNFA